MLVKISENGSVSDLRISFSYDVEKDGKGRRITCCNLNELNPETGKYDKVVYTTCAKCSKKDKFIKAEGRKKALTRMVMWLTSDKYKLDKNARTLIWKAYWKELGLNY